MEQCAAAWRSLCLCSARADGGTSRGVGHVPRGEAGTFVCVCVWFFAGKEGRGEFSGRKVAEGTRVDFVHVVARERTAQGTRFFADPDEGAGTVAETAGIPGEPLETGSGGTRKRRGGQCEEKPWGGA